jgi:capsular exopolysaccharide synthesis family protein
MSHIFDALQRSEAERGGVEATETSAATELLERAERQAVLQWRSSARSNRAEPAASEGELSFGPPERAAGETERPGPAVMATLDERSGVFAQFPVLEPSRPVQARLVSIVDHESPAAEAFRLLAVRLRHLRRDRTLRRLLVTSSIPQEGKSVVSANLACTLGAGSQQKTLLLEGDLRRPSLSNIFGLSEKPGICECLRGERSLTASIYRLPEPGIWILPAGSAQGIPLELLQSGKLPALMDQLTAWFDWVVIDSPPVMPLADTSIWSRVADGILLVARPGVTEKRQLQRGLEALESKKMIGALLNSSTSEDDDYYYYRRAPGETNPDRSGE